MNCMVTECADCVHFSVVRGVPYLGPDRKEQMDIYVPTCSVQEALPCVIVVPGGGWSAGRRGLDREAHIAAKLLAQGYVVMITDIAAVHRSGESWNQELVIPGWPTNVYDFKTAVRYARKHAADYRINPGKIGIVGGSTEGHIALLAALTANHQDSNRREPLSNYSSDVQCIIDLYGVSDVLSWGEESFKGVTYSKSPVTLHVEKAGKASAVEETKAGIPPLLIVHGKANESNSITLSASFSDHMLGIGEVHQYVAFEEASHSGSPTAPGARIQPPIDLRPVIFRFLDTYLK